LFLVIRDDKRKKLTNIFFKLALLPLITILFLGCGDSSNTQEIVDNNTTKQIDFNTTENVVDKNITKQPDINTTENNDSNQTDLNTTTIALPYELQSYYADAIGKSGDDLKDSLHTIVLNSAIFLTYSQDYEIMSNTDKDFSQPDEENVILFYLQTSATADSKCHSSSKECWNREHMWPKSLGVGYDSLVNTYTDLHHLRPSDAKVNSDRSNKPYGEARTPYSKISGFYSDKFFEVSDELKGNVARAILYMTVRYEGDNDEPDLEIYANDFSTKYPAELCTMLHWNHIDPVTNKDIRRNDIVQQYQGNRNPFVDNSSWVDAIWGAQCDD